MTKMVVEGSSVTASQLKDLFRQIEDGSVTHPVMQAFLEHRNPFAQEPAVAQERLATAEQQMITIDRSMPFDPSSFVGRHWEIDEQDDRSLALSDMDLSKVLLETTLKRNESWVRGEERLKRLKKQQVIRLDAKVFQILWENQNLIPESWKQDEKGNIRYIYFDGTILRDPDSYRCVLCLYFSSGQWSWGFSWLDSGFEAWSQSAVLASSSAL